MVPYATMWLDCGKKYDKEREKKREQEGLDQKNSIFIPLGKVHDFFPPLILVDPLFFFLLLSDQRTVLYCPALFKFAS